MINGNIAVRNQLTTLIGELLQGVHGSVYPFIILAGPAHIGKSSFINQLLDTHTIAQHDLAHLKDLSDDRIELKNINDLTGTFHVIPIDVESKRHEIKLDKDKYVHHRGIRELQDWLAHSPLGTDKVVFIENIERASGSARNALLKTLEEPLAHRLLIATTSHIDQVPATILSRGMIFQMHALTDQQMKEWVSHTQGSWSPEDHDDVLILAAGRPGIIVRLEQQQQLTHLLTQWKNIKQLINHQTTIAPLYQLMLTVSKEGHLDIIIDSILNRSAVGHPSIFSHTTTLLQHLSSNVNTDNLLFDWCCIVSQSVDHGIH